ncbi:MAG: T9SS type A sorting domain-containing protein [Candidatus Eisenbacteria bacterium]|nr:T9SS type A sorting domain-containing protein [Candidatus Eisenbacteria bacterium]
MIRKCAAAIATLLIVSGASRAAGEERAGIRDIQQGAYPPYSWVLVESVTVTAVAPDGFFAEEEGGGPWSGIWINRQKTPAVSVGDRVRVRGYYAEIRGLSLVSATDALWGSVEWIDRARSAPAAEKIAAGDVGEPYEGVLVSIGELIVLGPVGGGEWLALSFGEGEAGDTIRAGGTMAYTIPETGDTLALLTGPVHTVDGAYRIEPRNDDDIVLMEEATGAAGGAPARFRLYGNQPNPFNPSTHIAFDLPAEGRTRADVYDLSGRLVRVLSDRTLSAGSHTIRWDGTDDRGNEVSSAVYFCRVTHGGNTEVIKMSLVR